MYGFPAGNVCLSHNCSSLSIPYVWVGRGIRGVGMPTDGMAEHYSLFFNAISTWLLPQNRDAM
jgi:hypothetical protein